MAQSLHRRALLGFAAAAVFFTTGAEDAASDGLREPPRPVSRRPKPA